MKTKQIFFALFLIFFTGIFQKALALEDNFSISGFAGYYNISSSSFIDSDVDFESKAVYGMAMTYHLSPRFSVELSSTKYTSMVDLSFEGEKERLGEIKQVPLLYTLRFQFPIRKSHSHIYLGVGMGYFFNSFSHLKPAELNELFDVNLKHVDVNDSVAYLANAGAEMRLSKHFAVYMDLKAMFSQPKFDVVFMDGTKAEKDVGMNGALFTAGAKYYF